MSTCFQMYPAGRYIVLSRAEGAVQDCNQMRSGISRVGMLLLVASALGVKKPNPILKSASMVVTPLLTPVYKYEAPLQEAMMGWLPGGTSTKDVRAQIYSRVGIDPVVIYTYALSPFCTEAIRVLESTGCKFTVVELGFI